jgi:hypothetical protein
MNSRPYNTAETSRIRELSERLTRLALLLSPGLYICINEHLTGRLTW